MRRKKSCKGEEGGNAYDVVVAGNWKRRREGEWCEEGVMKGRRRGGEGEDKGQRKDTSEKIGRRRKKLRRALSL